MVSYNADGLANSAPHVKPIMLFLNKIVCQVILSDWASATSRLVIDSYLTQKYHHINKQ